MDEPRAVEVKVGILVAISIAILVGFVIVLGDFSFGDKVTLYADYPTSSGLKQGATVSVAGMPAGSVVGIEYKGGAMDETVGRRVYIRVHLELDPTVAATIHDDATIAIISAGVLGEKFVSISPGSPDAPVVQPSTVLLGASGGGMGEVFAKVSQALDAVLGLYEKHAPAIDSLLGTLDETMKEVHATVKEGRQEMKKLLSKADQILAKVDTMTDEALGLVKALQEVADPAEAKAIVAKLKKTTGAIAKDVPKLLAKADTLMDKAAGLADDLGGIAGDGKATLTDVQGRIGKVFDGLDGLMASLQEGPGPIPSLLNDPEIYDDIKELLADIKAHPWKMMWKK